MKIIFLNRFFFNSDDLSLTPYWCNFHNGCVKNFYTALFTSKKIFIWYRLSKNPKKNRFFENFSVENVFEHHFLIEKNKSIVQLDVFIHWIVERKASKCNCTKWTGHTVGLRNRLITLQIRFSKLNANEILVNRVGVTRETYNRQKVSMYVLYTYICMYINRRGLPFTPELLSWRSRGYVIRLLRPRQWFDGKIRYWH